MEMSLFNAQKYSICVWDTSGELLSEGNKDDTLTVACSSRLFTQARAQDESTDFQKSGRCYLVELETRISVLLVFNVTFPPPSSPLTLGVSVPMWCVWVCVC